MPLPLSATQARVLDALMERMTAWLSVSTEVSRISKGRISDVVVGGAVGGGNLASIEYAGFLFLPAPYLASYTPAVNDVVAVARTGSQVLILGRIVGTPPS